MKVLHVIPGLASRTGGPAMSAVDMSRALGALGVETSIFTTDLASTATGGATRPVRADELPPGSEHVDVRLFAARPPRRLAFSPALYRALERDARGYDLVHVHSLFLFPQWAAYRAARRARVPYVVSPHGTLDPYLRRRGRVRKALADRLWQRRMLEGASALHFGAPDEARLAKDVAPGVPRAVISNPVDVDAFASLPSGRAFRERRLGGHEGPVVLFLGRIAQKKGLDLLIRSFARAARELPEARLVIAGPDDEALGPELAELARAVGIAERTTFVGMLHGDERLEALAAADVWVLSSYSDASAVAVLEALAAGLPVMLSPAVNVAPEAALAGAAVVCELDAKAFGRELVALLCDPERRAALGRRAREYAQRFGHDAVGRELAAMYEQALNGR